MEEEHVEEFRKRKPAARKDGGNKAAPLLVIGAGSTVGILAHRLVAGQALQCLFSALIGGDDHQKRHRSRRCCFSTRKRHNGLFHIKQLSNLARHRGSQELRRTTISLRGWSKQSDLKSSEEDFETGVDKLILKQCHTQHGIWTRPGWRRWRRRGLRRWRRLLHCYLESHEIAQVGKLWKGSESIGKRSVSTQLNFHLLQALDTSG